jgi:hypothetical protein
MGIFSPCKFFKCIGLFICLLFSGCFFVPCKTTLTIENKGNPAKIILIDGENNFIDYEIKNKHFFNNKIMNDIKYLYIKNDTIEGVFELREYDHWFAMNHNIKIIIKNNKFEIENDRKNIHFTYSYETWTDRHEQNVDFETVKKTNYKNIYEIINNIKILDYHKRYK